MTLSPPRLELNPVDHSYRLDGKPIPGVTSIINSVLPGFQADPWYLNRGRCLHAACHLADRTVLDWSSVSPEIKPRVDAWLAFRQDWRAECVLAEVPLAHPVYRYAGTMDRAFEREGKVIVCDLKSSLEPQVSVQIGGYGLLYEANFNRKPYHGVAVELRADGTYKAMWLDSHEMKRAGQVFLSCLTVHGFMVKHNLFRNKTDA